jgi:DNA-binding SARP family transcriptional activator
MRFNVLGPLEALSADAVVPLGGFNQRATLGALLLRANTVVATSHLVKALWDEDPPVTARKMLQNAVSGLRTVLADHADGTTALLTHAPGYVLRVEPQDVDLLRFQELVDQGRTASAAAEWEDAETALRSALALWRGPALADLRESGIGWADLTTLENARLSALEDYAEAQLAVGRHVAVVNDLEQIVADADIPRERMCRQLMLALYRCGRQVDALTVYRRNRAALAEKLGLDPGRELQELERAILSHDPGLAAPADRAAIEVAGPQTAGAGPRRPVGDLRVAVVSEAAPPRTPDLAGPEPREAAAERKRISVLQVRVSLMPAFGDDPEAVDEKLEALTLGFRDEVERFGGVVQGLWAVGSGWVALFGVPRTRENDAERAVRAAMAVRDRFDLLGEGDSAEPAVSASLAVATGEVLVTSRGGADPDAVEVTGGLLDLSQRLVELAPGGQIRVCGVTREATERNFAFATGGDGGDLVLTASAETAELDGIPFLERSREIVALSNLLDDVRQHRRPHLVTVLGEPGIGKSRLVEELRQRVTRSRGRMRWLAGRAPAFGVDVTTTVLAEVVRSFAGITFTDPDVVARRRLSEAVHGLFADPEAADRILAHLRPLLGISISDRDHKQNGSSPSDDTLAAWRRLLEEIAITEPLVVAIEDLHLADKRFLDFVEHFVDRTARIPLLVLTTARSEMLLHRPYWSGGKRNAFMLTLEPLSDEGTRRLLKALAVRYDLCAGPESSSGRRRTNTDGCVELFARIGGNPLFAVEYFRMHREMAEEASSRGERWQGEEGDVLSLPPPVRSIIAARLDTLPPVEKAVLRDAAVIGETVWPSAVAAVGGRDIAEVTRCLEYLERRDFLYRVGDRTDIGEPVSAFRHMVVREVAYAQMPRSARAERHLRAARWAEQWASSRCPDLPEHHYREAISLTAAAGRHSGRIQAIARDALHRTGGGREHGDGFLELIQALDTGPRFSAAS